ncbi:hypothetical protein LPJ61_001333 [Coemansia biformis]|uniref:Uncharacterized protein n=1 Tax=Coemansia biformis TaxID=1286918 RepID=A0A9W7YGW9_9FUNG|nr:hypothetical protein LPJ61_001333 [Coemansia biformis]
MHINSLPVDVLRIILQQTLYTPFTGSESWKHQLPLLSVCSAWRYLAVPIVYKHMFVVHTCHSPDDERDAGDLASVPAAPTNVNTNMHLVASNGHASLVRHAEIKILIGAEPFSGVTSVLCMLRAVCRQWSRINMLTLSLAEEMTPANRGTNAAPCCRAQIGLVASAMLELLPGLTGLRFRGYGGGQLVEDIYGAIASRYSGQLAQLVSRRPITLSERLCFGQMTRLDLRVGTVAGYRIPQVLAGPLVALSLKSIPANFSWADFIQDSDADAIEFPSLAVLSLNYRSGGVRATGDAAVPSSHAYGCKMYFPKLHSLHLWNTTGYCPMLASAVLPATMASLDIVGSSGAIAMLERVRLPEVGRLSLSVTATSPAMQSATLPALNRIVSKAVVRAEASIIILEDTIAFDDRGVVWPNLTHLQVAAPTRVDAVVEIVGRLPALVEAVFYSILIEGIPEEAFLLDGPVAEHTRVRPLNVVLRRLMLDHERSECPERATAATIKYLALALPSLLVLSVWLPLEDDLLSFIDSYKCAYPHLSNIKFRLGAGE